MDKGDRPVYCGNCGSIARASDRFCGVCGAAIPPDAQAATPTEKTPVLVQEPRQDTPASGGAVRRPRWVVPVALLIVMIASTGTLAYAALRGGPGMSGGQVPESAEAPPPQERRPEEPSPLSDEEPNTTSVPPGTADGSERERLRSFVSDYQEAAIREDWEATYSMLDETSQQEFTEEEWAEKQQALRDAVGLPARLESITIDQNDEVSDSPAIATLYFEDGTEETLTVGIPMAVTSEEEAGEPKRILGEEEMSDLRSVSEEGSNAPQSEAEVEEAAGDYYRAAGAENWDYTYDNLDSETQGAFTREEWRKKNLWFADNNPAIYHIESVRLDGSSPESIAEVGVRLTGEDGSSSIRTTYFVSEGGEWKHRFGREEHDLFMPDTPYEEFVQAQEG